MNASTIVINEKSGVASDMHEHQAEVSVAALVALDRPGLGEAEGEALIPR